MNHLCLVHTPLSVEDSPRFLPRSRCFSTWRNQRRGFSASSQARVCGRGPTLSPVASLPAKKTYMFDVQLDRLRSLGSSWAPPPLLVYFRDHFMIGLRPQPDKHQTGLRFNEESSSKQFRFHKTPGGDGCVKNPDKEQLAEA